MLWQTETNSDLYVDLIKGITCEVRSFRLHRKKNNDLSVQMRMDGNIKYNRNDYKGAVTKYNESICLAVDSEQLSLSYANRSQCFLKLRNYDCCLNDIRLAKEAGYPRDLMSKLESRQSECVKHLDSKIVSSLSSVSTDHQDQISGISSAIQIDSDSLHGRYMKAIRDIQIGETLLVEESYIRIVNDDGSNDCTNCGKTKSNFIPCENCADAMFCCSDCKENHFHENECDIVFGSLENIDWLAFILRSVIVGINTFATVEDLMECVKHCLSADRFEVPELCNSPIRKYRTFFKLTCSESYVMISDSLKVAYFVFHAIMNSSKLAPKFRNKSTQRFLVHLIIHHHIVLRKNAFGYERDGAYVHELSLLTSHINHSCLPNVAKLSNANVSVCKSILPIKRNEQLFLSYIAEEVFGMTERQRNDQLETLYEFRCKCELCKYGTLRAPNLELDPSFVYVTTKAKTNDFNVNVVKSIIEHCVTFLVQYSDMRRAQELHYISEILTAMYSKVINEQFDN